LTKINTQYGKQRVQQSADPPDDGSNWISSQRHQRELETATTERAAVPRTTLGSTSL